MAACFTASSGRMGGLRFAGRAAGELLAIIVPMMQPFDLAPQILRQHSMVDR